MKSFSNTTELRVHELGRSGGRLCASLRGALPSSTCADVWPISHVACCNPSLRCDSNGLPPSAGAQIYLGDGQSMRSGGIPGFLGRCHAPPAGSGGASALALTLDSRRALRLTVAVFKMMDSDDGGEVRELVSLSVARWLTFLPSTVNLHQRFASEHLRRGRPACPVSCTVPYRQFAHDPPGLGIHSGPEARAGKA
jgi:hypothetical protein